VNAWSSIMHMYSGSRKNRTRLPHHEFPSTWCVCLWAMHGCPPRAVALHRCIDTLETFSRWRRGRKPVRPLAAVARALMCGGAACCCRAAAD
jgi:hypothetical protein